MESEKDIIRLIRRYRAGTATAEEVRELMACIHAGNHTELIETFLSQGLLDNVSGTEPSPYLQAKFDRIYEQINQQRKTQLPSKSFRKWQPAWVSYAAVLIIALTIGVWLSMRRSQQPNTTDHQQVVIQPGRDRATLIFADGSTLELDSTQRGIVVRDGNIRYPNGNSIQRKANDTPSDTIQKNALLQLSTPKGGTYRVTLPDGTKVWLNAASTLTYPFQFSGNSRTVEISGEGFFEIEPDSHRPFKVRSDGQEVLVLGTSFNVVAYPDETPVKTTLISGSVVVNTLDHRSHQPMVTKRLLPSQQAVVENGNVRINEVDSTNEIAWRNGLITFTGKPFSDIMREIARWYDIDIHYEHTVPDIALYGGINRGDNFHTVLKLLQVSDVPCRLEERKLIIE